MKAFKGEFERGDVILANHPLAGGSHLPDLTVITPVFYEYFFSDFGILLFVVIRSDSTQLLSFCVISSRNVEKPVFFVASRGHHADIGGITPGSMPPHSTCLLQVIDWKF